MDDLGAILVIAVLFTKGVALLPLGGVGFTVSLLIAELSLVTVAAERAKAAVLLTSAAASLIGAVGLLHRSRVHNRG